MMMELILCNCPDLQVAERITQQLLERKLAACVNVLPAVQSHYVWLGKLEQSTEIPLLIKARKEDFIGNTEFGSQVNKLVALFTVSSKEEGETVIALDGAGSGTNKVGEAFLNSESSHC